MKSKTVQIPNINWSKVIRASLIATVLGAVCVVGTPAKSSYAVSWGGCSGNCAGIAAPNPDCIKDPSLCESVDTSETMLDVAVDESGN